MPHHWLWHTSFARRKQSLAILWVWGYTCGVQNSNINAVFAYSSVVDLHIWHLHWVPKIWPDLSVVWALEAVTSVWTVFEIFHGKISMERMGCLIFSEFPLHVLAATVDLLLLCPHCTFACRTKPAYVDIGLRCTWGIWFLQAVRTEEQLAWAYKHILTTGAYSSPLTYRGCLKLYICSTEPYIYRVFSYVRVPEIKFKLFSCFGAIK